MYYNLFLFLVKKDFYFQICFPFSVKAQTTNAVPTLSATFSAATAIQDFMKDQSRFVFGYLRLG
jgi:hypothetical protein